MEKLSKVLDVFFNGRPAEPDPSPHVRTLQEIVARGTSLVRVGDKYYQIVAEEIDLASIKRKSDG